MRSAILQIQPRRSFLYLSIFLISIGTTGLRATEQPYAREIEFASALVRGGFPDFAERIVDEVLRRHPDAAPHAAFVRIEMLTARGRFDEAREVIAGMPPDTLETLSMQLALGDALYAWNRMREAREIYEKFFQRFPEGPPPEMAGFYRESAYRYAQMLMNTGHEAEALKAFGFILLSDPEREVKRRIQTEIAELALKLGTQAKDKERENYFDQARRLAHELQWGGLDLWFGKSVVILAHMEVVNGNLEEARAIIREYLPMLRQIDDALRAEKAPMRFSPMAECRYLLGMLHLREAEALREAESEEEAIKQYADALRHLHNVFIQYPGSAWAMEAGNTARRIVSILESMGRRVRVPPFDMGPVIEAQLQEARMLLDMNDFERAKTAYHSILNLFPEEPNTVPILADLVRCYIELNDPIFAQAVIGYLAERFHRNDNLRDAAGTALLRVAGVYEKLERPEGMNATYDLFFNYYPEHPRAASVLLRRGETALRQEAYTKALEYYQAVRDQYPESREALDAMSRIAFCHSALEQPVLAIPVLQEYIDALPRGPGRIRAIYRLGDAYRANGQYREAADQYRGLIERLSDTSRAQQYTHSAEDTLRNRDILEQALFWMAFSESRIQEPVDQQPQLRRAAINSYRQFLETFPQSDLAPSALSMKGALLLVLDQSEDAARIYDRLARDFPNSEQARNAVFAQGSSLIELGQMQRAIEVFEQMFDQPERFAPAQFLRVARVMRDENQPETALRALDMALKSDDRPVWEHAAVLKGGILLQLQRYAESGTILETLMKRYPQSPHSIEAGFQLSAAHAHQAAAMEPGPLREETFQKAISALRMARRRAQMPFDRARADYELAALQRLMNQPNEAAASYLRLFLLGNLEDRNVRPLIEKAYEAAIPLLFEMRQFAEVVDTSQVYLASFPGGRLAGDARRWRDQARFQMAQAGMPVTDPAEPNVEEIRDFQPIAPRPEDN